MKIFKIFDENVNKMKALQKDMRFEKVGTKQNCQFKKCE